MNKASRIAIIHSRKYVELLAYVTESIHQDRDVLLQDLLECYGFLGDRSKEDDTDITQIHSCDDNNKNSIGTTQNQEQILKVRRDNENEASSFSSLSENDNKRRRIVQSNTNTSIDASLPLSSFLRSYPPFEASLDLMEKYFHSREYLEMLKYDESDKRQAHDNNTHNKSTNEIEQEILEKYGLIDDCPMPDTPSMRYLFWKYCQYNAGGSLLAAHLLLFVPRKTPENINAAEKRCNQQVDKTRVASSSQSEFDSLLLGRNVDDLFRNNLRRCLVDDTQHDISIHWAGGRHHAQKSQANGFCYINDIVISIRHLLLLQNSPICDYLFVNEDQYNITQSSDEDTDDDESNEESKQKKDIIKNRGRVLYIDIDIHHGDGVQEAFYDTDEVLTCSFHRHTRSFFPYVTGSIKEKGKQKSKGLGYNVNVPIPAGCNDDDFHDIFQYAIKTLVQSYNPKVIVICVGVDGLKGDPLIQGQGEVGWSLTCEGYAKCLEFLATFTQNPSTTATTTTKPSSSKHEHSDTSAKDTIKLLVFGGGGYDPVQAAKTYLLCTASLCESIEPGFMKSGRISSDIPSHRHFHRYGPNFELFSSEIEDDNELETSTKKDARIYNEEYQHILQQGKRAISLAGEYINCKQEERRQKIGMIHGSMENVNFSDNYYDSLNQSLLTKNIGRKKNFFSSTAIDSRNRTKENHNDSSTARLGQIMNHTGRRRRRRRKSAK